MTREKYRDNSCSSMISETGPITLLCTSEYPYILFCFLLILIVNV